MVIGASAKTKKEIASGKGGGGPACTRFARKRKRERDDKI